MNNISKELMENYLVRYYSITKLKYKGHFKRAIKIDNGKVYFLNNKECYPELKENLAKILKKVFDCELNMSEKLVNDFLYLLAIN